MVSGGFSGLAARKRCPAFMKIKLLVSVSGDKSNHIPGDIVDFESGWASRMIASGQAIAVDVKPSKSVNTRTKRIKKQDETR